jgi:hypothetical protein
MLAGPFLNKSIKIKNMNIKNIIAGREFNNGNS